jgi:hypothetical protein
MSDSYGHIYKRIETDIVSDIDLILKYLSGISEDINWFDDDIFNKVLEMRDRVLTISKRVKIPQENPKWDHIYKILQRAAVRGKQTGIFKVDEPDSMPFYKKTFKSGDQDLKIDVNLIQELQSKP